MNEQQLLQIKKNLEDKKLSVANKQGQLDGEKKKLKEEFGVKGSKEAKSLLEEKSKELDALEEKLEKDTQEFLEKYKELLKV